MMPRVLSRIGTAFANGGFGMYDVRPEPPPEIADPLARYAMLRAFYEQNYLYAARDRIARDIGVATSAQRNLRSPVYRVVEFYVAHLWGDLQIEAETDAVADAVKQVWRWSNWDANRLLAARMFARDGDLFIKAVSQPEDAENGLDGRVYLRLVDAAHVIDFDTDARGNVTYMHIEIPSSQRNEDGDIERYTHVEVWDDTTRRIWRLEEGQDRRGTPAQVTPIERFGIDFVPFTHAKFKDVGDKRGQAAVTHAIEKINEANTVATRLHQMLYRHNDAFFALKANGTDADGRPLPPPTINGIRTDGKSDTVTLGGDTFISLPGNTSIEPLVPGINYDAALAVVDAMVAEVERDLPELVFYQLREQGNISGVAARMMMTDAIAKIVEARGNIEQALIRADMMALTLGKRAELEGFTGLGEFNDGALYHTFKPRDAIARSEEERWAAVKASAEAAVYQQRIGISVAATLRERGYTDDQIAQFAAEREAERPNAFAAAMGGLSADDAAALFGAAGQ